MSKIQSLNGLWDYRIGKGEFFKKEVPFSALPVGHSEVMCNFDLAFQSDAISLKFDGITYAAKVFLNNVELGEMLPYSEYVFDITEIAEPIGNQLLVEIEDIAPDFGPTEGWGNYGGIIRDVSLVYNNAAHLKDVFFKSELKNHYRDAEYSLEISATGEKIKYEISISDDNGKVDSYISDKIETRYLKDIKLWSCETPNLYTLNVKLFSREILVDEYECRVGFREFRCDRHRFILNGEPLFLQGVCKHEMFEGSGHTVTPELIEKDLRMIKETGCNFVRLVHYPHSKKTLEIADRLGLMVSEEPGLWWSETQVPNVAEGSLEVLRRTILRDRNHPSIVFWLCFNECKFTEQFLIDSARVCRENDPTRLVSGANCMSNEETLKFYNICGFDFYTMHPYSDTFKRALESAKVLNDKPLMFTEWGGYFLYDNPHLLSDFIHSMYSLYKNNSDDGALAGASFWYWAEVNDFGRGKPACVDGVLKEALVDIHRNPTLIYETYKQAWKDAATSVKAEDEYYYKQILDVSNMKAASIECTGETNDLIGLLAHKEPEKFNRMRGREILIGPILQNEEITGIYKKPISVAKGNSVVCNINATLKSFSVLGMISPKGYPILGEYGELYGNLIIRFDDNTNEVIPLRNGYEITTAFSSVGSSIINPIAANAKRFAEFGYEKNFENYIINKFDVKFPLSKKIESLTFENIEDNCYLIYGIIF